MKNIYVAVSSLNTRVGKIKSTLTEFPYNHVSVSFSRGLSRMYSFSRQLHDVPLVGGFTEELPSRILSGGGDVPLMLYELEVDDEEYGRIEGVIKRLSEHPQKYSYNLLDEAAALLGGRCGVSYAYTDLSFVCKLLRLGDIKDIKELCFVLEPKKIYEGTFNEAVDNENEYSGGEYFKRVSPLKAAVKITAGITELAARKIYEML